MHMCFSHRAHSRRHRCDVHIYVRLHSSAHVHTLPTTRVPAGATAAGVLQILTMDAKQRQRHLLSLKVHIRACASMHRALLNTHNAFDSNARTVMGR